LTNKGFLESYKSILLENGHWDVKVNNYLGVLLLVLSSGSSSGEETSLLLLLGFGAVLVEELEQLGGGVLVQSVGELGNGRGDLQALAEDDLLALKADILGPLDETGEVSLGLNVLAFKGE
jgi:hypothetical protein